ncbi:hypothetical protein BH10ACI2_BH10ACI2_08060 [soil metagenome]
MDAELWQRAKTIFEQVVGLGPEERRDYLDSACKDEPDVRSEVEELLNYHDRSDGFMDGPAVNEVAEELIGKVDKIQNGKILLHYEIIKPLGEGGMGEVYLARDTKLFRKVAIKVLPTASATDDEANQRLLREAQSAAKLDHPNICTIYQIAEEDGRRFIVMQYVAGENLAHELSSGNLDLRSKLKIATQIAEALSAAHKKGIIHRDIKPANVIISENLDAKVLDFGLAKVVDTGNMAGGDTMTAHMFSTTGAIMGTIPYMSPEQVKGEKLDARTDIFSLGAMLYEMVCGVQPFRRGNNAETIAALLNYDPPMSDAQVDLRPILEKCLAKDKDRRIRDAGELAADLRSVHGDSISAMRVQQKQPGFDEALTIKNLTEKQSSALAAETRAVSETLVLPSRSLTAAAIILLLIVIGGVVSAGYYWSGSKPPAVAVAEKMAIDSLAVLPFENSNLETEYLSDGIAESLINSMSNLSNLRVISRAAAFGFKGKKESLQEIGKSLNVQAILTGKFSQQGDLVTIQAELNDVRTDAQLWGDRFTVKQSDLMQVQQQIAGKITDALQLKLDNQQKAQIAKHYTDNPDAYREYLKGRYFTLQYSPEGHKKALEHLNKAIEIDPTYALAFAGLADAYTTASDGLLPPREALTKAKAASQKAIDLDAKLAEAWAAHGHARLHEWDRNAIGDLNKAIELSPNALTTQLWLGEYYLIWDVEKSVKILEKAADLDPLSPLPPAFLSFAYYMLRQSERSIEYAKKAIDIDPTFLSEHAYLARFYSFTGDYKSAASELDKIPPEAVDGFAVSTRGAIFALQGKRAEAEKAVFELQAISKKQYVSPVEFAFVYNALGDRDKTFFYLEKAFDDRSENISFIRNLPDYDKIRDDPRYTDLIRRMGF